MVPELWGERAFVDDRSIDLFSTLSPVVRICIHCKGNLLCWGLRAPLIFGYRVVGLVGSLMIRPFSKITVGVHSCLLYPAAMFKPAFLFLFFKSAAVCFKKSWGARQMVWRLRSLTALAKDLSLVPSVHTGKLTTICNSSFLGSNTSGLLRHLHSHAHTHKHVI